MGGSGPVDGRDGAQVSFLGYPRTSLEIARRTSRTSPSPAAGAAIAQARAQQPAYATDPALGGVFTPGMPLPPRSPSRDRNGRPQTGTAMPRPGAAATLLAQAPITTDKTRSADVAAALAKKRRLSLGGSY